MDIIDLTVGGVYTKPDLENLKDILEACGLKVLEVDFGKTLVEGIERDIQFDSIATELEKENFVLINDKVQWLVEKVKISIHKRLGYSDKEEENRLNFSDIISQELGKDYRYLSTVFTKQEGITIEKYIIEQRIQMAKKMLRCKKLRLEDIALRLDYSSIAYFSNQFKKVTGCSPSQYRKLLSTEGENMNGCSLAS